VPTKRRLTGFEECDGGEDVPVGARGGGIPSLAKMCKGAQEIYYPDASQGLPATLEDQVNADLLAFLGS